MQENHPCLWLLPSGSLPWQQWKETDCCKSVISGSDLLCSLERQNDYAGMSCVVQGERTGTGLVRWVPQTYAAPSWNEQEQCSPYGHTFPCSRTLALPAAFWTMYLPPGSRYRQAKKDPQWACYTRIIHQYIREPNSEQVVWHLRLGVGWNIWNWDCVKIHPVWAPHSGNSAA